MTEANLDAHMDTPNPIASQSATNMMDVALDYAKRGWKVFPVHSPGTPGACSCRSPQCKKIGKHPRIISWNTEATTDTNRVTNWWSQWPNANIGVVTGAASGIWVLDVDNKNDGSRTLQRLLDENGPLPETLTSRTGRGRHLYFAHPGIPIKGSVQEVGDGLDVRGDGQYVVAPGSMHANGKRYEWLDPNASIATAPDWLLSIVTTESVAHPRRASQADTSISLGLVSPNCLPEGIRNVSLFRIACYLFSSGMARERVELTMLLFNKVKCQPNLSTVEVKGLVQSAYTYSQIEDGDEDAESAPDSLQPKRRRRKMKSRSPIFWFKNFPAQNLSDSQLAQLEDYQLGWRSRAVDFAFAQGCLLPDDVNQLRKLVRPNCRKKFEKEWPIALYDFQKIELDGQTYLYHPVLFSEYIDAATQALVNKANAERKLGIGKADASRPTSVVTPPVEASAA